MTTEDQIVALFADANPVPSLDVFDPVEPLDIGRLEKRAERSRGMLDTSTVTREVRASSRWLRLAFAAALPLVVVVTLAILVNRDSRVAAVPLPSTGSLDPGTYYISDSLFTPRRFSFTVPAGWTTVEGFVSKNLEGQPIPQPTKANNVMLATWIVTHVYADACDWAGTIFDVAGTGGTLPTVNQLTNALLAQRGRVASAPTDVILGGYPAKRIELTIPADLDIAATCDSGIIRFWPDTGGDQSGGLCCAPAGSTEVVYVVDVDGSAFAVVARYAADSSPQDRAELDHIVASIRIDPPASSSFTSP